MTIQISAADLAALNSGNTVTIQGPVAANANTTPPVANTPNTPPVIPSNVFSIAGFTPKSGNVGSVITITGSGFVNVSAVKVGLITVPPTKIVNDAEILVNVPVGAVNSGIALQTANGEWLFDNDVFTITGNSTGNSANSGGGTTPPVVTPPAINSSVLSIQTFSPNTGSVGSLFTILGTGLSNVTQLKIGGLTFAPTKVVNDSQIIATVPSGAVTGSVAVGTANGTWVFDSTPFNVVWQWAQAPIPTVNVANAPLVASTHVPSRTIIPLTPPATGMKFITIKGNTFVDQTGTEIVPHGVNLSGLEDSAMQKWSNNWEISNYWSDSGFPGMPPINVLKEWGVQIVRIPYCSASWLNLVCVDGLGTKLIPADPVGIYSVIVDQAILEYTAAGFYILLEQHWNAPFLKTIPNYPNGAFLAPEGQGSFSDATTSPAAFAEIATRYSKFTNVLLGCFNEPYLDSFGPTVPADVGVAQKSGGTCARFVNGTDGGNDYTITETWELCGFQNMIDAARNAGFTGPISVSDRAYAQDFSAWLTNVPKDSLNNIFADWHPYPAYGTVWGTPDYNYAPFGKPGSKSETGVIGTCYEWALNIKAAGYPIMITEYGDKNTANTIGAPFASTLTTWAVANKIPTIAWAFMVTNSPNFSLLKDVNGTPTDGYGVFTKQFLTTGNTTNTTSN